MKITKTRLKQIIKEELQLAIDEAKLAPAGAQGDSYCVGWAKKPTDKRTYETIQLSAPGFAAREVKRRVEGLKDEHIRSTHKGKCNTDENKKRQARAEEERVKKQKEAGR